MTNYCAKFLRFLILAALFVYGLLPAAPAHAQAGSADEPSQCVTCHQDLYLYYDTGKHYCLCNPQVACTDCHLGDPLARTAEAAHVGMIPRPACQQTNTCVNCHLDDTQQHIQAFAAAAGMRVTPCPLPECEHPTALNASSSSDSATAQKAGIPWRDLAAGLLGVSALGLIGLALYIYQSDLTLEELE